MSSRPQSYTKIQALLPAGRFGQLGQREGSYGRRPSRASRRGTVLPSRSPAGRETARQRRHRTTGRCVAARASGGEWPRRPNRRRFQSLLCGVQKKAPSDRDVQSLLHDGRSGVGLSLIGIDHTRPSRTSSLRIRKPTHQHSRRTLPAFSRPPADRVGMSIDDDHDQPQVYESNLPHPPLHDRRTHCWLYFGLRCRSGRQR
jgi:hypothetical protein